MMLGILAVGVSFGLARMVWGLCEINRLHRLSREVTDDRFIAILEELSRAIGVERLPSIGESSDVVSAAVIGWRRPTLVLPLGWREWSPAELRAVIAHELAHIHRRDFGLRLVAAFAVALQWAQPLAHSLRRQLMLAQEIAADELAAVAIGSKSAYLQALSQLALRHDCPSTCGPAVALVPVFSGFLLRRIVMLRAKDGSADRKVRLLVQGSAIAILVVATGTTTALRGLAEPPASQADGSVRLAKKNDPPPVPAAISAKQRAAQAAAATLFKRPPLDLSSIDTTNSGGFALRLGEMLSRAGTEYTRELNEWFAAGWKDALPMAEPANWRLQDIELIAGDFSLIVKPASQPTQEYSNTVMFGASCVMIRWTKALEGQFVSLAHIPGGVEKTHGNRKYVALPMIPALGPSKPCVCRIDERTILGAKDETVLIRNLDQLGATANPPTWGSAWQRADGGWLTLVSTDAKFVRPFGEPVDDESKLISDFLAPVRTIAISVDSEPQAGGISSARLQLRFDTLEEANTSVRAFQRLVVLSKEKMNSEPADVSDKEAEAGQKMLEFLEQATIHKYSNADGWHVDLQFAGDVDYLALLKP
jgi:beta-lactamase regulating signal transducer with metallopeptidase domain